MPSSEHFPRLRPIEVFPSTEGGREILVVHDPSGIAANPMAISPPALLIFSLMDGEHDLDEIRSAFFKQVGSELPADRLQEMVDQLDEAMYLDSEKFRDFLQMQEETYRAAPTRKSDNEASFGAGGDGLAPMLARLLEKNKPIPPQQASRLVGLVAPHLDFERGQPCYADVYHILAGQSAPQRVVILGTNHFGQATSTVVTRKDFETPLGITQTDRVFIEELQARCGSDLCQNEVDHQREHSVELQILMLQHVLGAENFTIVPTICPDPCGPTGTKPWNGQGVDLRVFAEQLGQMIRETTEETIIVTGADLSHIGMRFGDEKQLDADFCNQIEQQDRRTLEAILTGNPSQFLETVTSHQNSTRICSVGCLYAMMTALAGNRRELLRYHQAIDADNGVGVSCASMAFWND